MTVTPLIIDTDPGIDDAIAIAFAVFSPEFDVKLITTVVGNVGIDNTTSNALRLLQFFGKDIPVARGAGRPLLREHIGAENIHGRSGMEGFELPQPNMDLLLRTHAVEAMRNTLLSSDEPITLMPIGPLTNIALLLRMYPEVTENISQIVLMGGSTGRGNMGVMSEFNIFTDPEAAKIVINSGLPLVMATLDAGLGTVISPERTAQLPEFGEVGRMAHDLFRHHRKKTFGTGLKMYDACAVACLLQPDIFTFENTHVDVEVSGTLTAGCTVVDLKGYLGEPPNALVTTGVNASHFEDWFIDMIRRCN